MALVSFGSVRSCGATTLVLALAATWPAQRRVLVVEADPAGGTLAAALGWSPEPSLVTLAAAARRDGSPELVWEHCQALPGGAAALAGPASGDQARAALGVLGALLARLGELDADVLVDCGRLGPGTALDGLLEASGRVVLATRPRVAELHALATWLESRPPEARLPELVTVGAGPYPDSEIVEALGTDVLARLPHDPGAAEALAHVPASARQLRMAPLVRAARSLAGRLAADMAAAPAGQVDPVPLAPGPVPLQRRNGPWWPLPNGTAVPTGSAAAKAAR
jgi:hypothetical protein